MWKKASKEFNIFFSEWNELSEKKLKWKDTFINF